MRPLSVLGQQGREGAGQQRREEGTEHHWLSGATGANVLRLGLFCPSLTKGAGTGVRGHPLVTHTENS